jgi:hypothetical protein
MVPITGTNTDLSDVTTRAAGRFNSRHHAGDRADLIPVTARAASPRPTAPGLGLGAFWKGQAWAKPKGMHWRTYERLCDEYDALNDIMSCNFMARFGLSLAQVPV